MKYKDQINPELRGIAKRIPYNRAIIRCANLYQVIAFCLAAVPKEVTHRKSMVKGYQGMKCNAFCF